MSDIVIVVQKPIPTAIAKKPNEQIIVRQKPINTVVVINDEV